MIELGSKVRCTINGFEGVAVARVEFINGCVQYEVLPKVAKDGSPREAVGIDEQSLEVIPVKKKKVVTKKTGGAMSGARTQRCY